MRRPCSLICFAAAGLVVGLAVSRALLAFSPRCGYDCETYQVFVWLVAEIGCLGAFIGVWYLAFRNAAQTAKRVFTVCLMTAMAALVPAWLVYGWNLRTHYRELEAKQQPWPSVDFSHMAIATRKTPTLSIESEKPTRTLREIHQWERCLIGPVECSLRPRRAQMQCKDGIVDVSEEHWHAFSLIQSEDLPGILPLQSMDLCEAKQ